MINKLISLLINICFPIPIVKEALIEVLQKYKAIFLGVLVSFCLLPFLFISLVFSGKFVITEKASEERMARQYFDTKYNSTCRDESEKCEPKPQFRSEKPNCKITPEKCRLIRPKINCSTMPNRCSTYTDEKGNVTTRASEEEEEKYYQQHQNSEEAALNIFKWIFERGVEIVVRLVDEIGRIIGSPLSYTDPPQEITNYTEPTLISNNDPIGNPFGGIGYENSIVTCVYHCINYDTKFGQHQGMDLVASDDYYRNNQGSKKSGNLPIVYATCSGKGKSTSNSISGNLIIIKCHDSDYFVQYFHLQSQYLPPIESNIKVGQPIGVMGNTGEFTTGSHLHYQINKDCLNYSTACTRDPRLFISKEQMPYCQFCN